MDLGSAVLALWKAVLVKQWARVQVEWVDSHETAGWQFTKDLANDGTSTKMTPCVSIGFVYRESEDVLVIAATMSNRGDPDNEQVMGLFAIPKVSIKRIRRLSLP